MANYTYNVTTFADNESGILSGVITLPTPPDLTLEPNDTVTFVWQSHSGYAIDRLALLGLDSSVWTNNSNVLLTSVGQSTTKTVLSTPAYITDIVSFNIRADGQTFQSNSFDVIIVDPNDNTPTGFTFDNVTGVAPGAQYPARPFKVTGMSNGLSATISITNGGSSAGQFQFRVNAGSWRHTSTTVQNEDVVYFRCNTPTAFSTTVSSTMTIGGFTATAWSVTTGNEDSISFIPLGISSGTIRLASDVGDFYGRPVWNETRLTNYYRGGTYVPNITQNNSVPLSGTIQLTDFYNSGTSFFFATYPSGKEYPNYNSLSSAATLQLNWAVGVDFDMGFGAGMNAKTQFRYELLNMEKQEFIGTTGFPWLTGSGTVTSFNLANDSVDVNFSAPQNSEIFVWGTLRIHARLTWNSVNYDKFFDVPFFFSTYGP